jgi:adhesin transport system outer membrane protein
MTVACRRAARGLHLLIAGALAWPLASGATPSFADLPQLLGLAQPLDVQARGQGNLDLVTAVQRGLATSPDLEAASARADQAGHQVDVLRGALRPRAEMRLAAGRGRLHSTNPDLELDRQDHNLIVRQALIDEGTRRDVSRQRLQSDATKAQLAQTRVGLQAGEQQERRLLDLAGRIDERASPQAPADRDRVAARLSNVRSGLAESRAAVQGALRNLERLSGEFPRALVIGPVPQAPLPADDREALEQMRRHNHELRGLRLEAEAAQREVAVRQARFLPRVELEVSHFRNRNIAGFPGRYADTKALAIMTVPLSSGGADLAGERLALARAAEADARVRGAERRLTQDVETAYSDLQSLAERYAAVASELDSNRRLADAFGARPYGPALAVGDVVDAYQRLAQSQTDLVQVLVSLAQTRWRLALLVGQLDFTR